ncbi:YadA-like family protein [Paraburkholderia sp. BL27I4N3]|uniref:YadA C-terminal domain-containing protein n=1 Tax=Paraburkholderia sp. BL27I4N3 TaxID=1938805 RepID=UPI0038574A82
MGIGNGAVVDATAPGGVAIGSGAQSSAIDAIAMGAGASATMTNSVALGAGSVQSGINSVARNAYSGIAAATALTMIPEVDKDKTLSFGIGTAGFRGYQAVASGGTARLTENVKMKAGVGMSPGGTTFGMGAAMQS